MITDHLAFKYPVSVKGVIIYDEQVPLLKNERDEWELPGGKLDKGERIEDCLRREIKEELNLDCKVGQIVDAWVYNIANKVDVLIIVYHVQVASLDGIKYSSEHKELRIFDIETIPSLNIPNGYIESIRKLLKDKL